ncbi:MAG: UDP-N-acetylglucosamine--N-acetylmuramyl-(pentapeptide) pyrophosphoryl-undecaprenol N-acetylglucosamine transferase [Patescibacteria group bacterium]
MKIALTGGGTGGHFYPVIAIAQELGEEIREQKLVDVELFYISDAPYNARLLFENKLTFIPVTAGKQRRYFSILNFFDWFKIAFGGIRAIISLYKLYPDVVFGKGGYATFPALFAARILGIPVVIHESDTEPGRVNGWAAKFAKKILISWPTALSYFPKEKTEVVGLPIRKELLHPIPTGASEFLHLEEGLPVLFIVGGSLGSEKINDTILDILPDLIEKYQVIHQTGKKHFGTVRAIANVSLKGNPHASRYKPFDYLNETAMRLTAGVANLVISRAGSAVFEFAQWGLPALLIPIPQSISHDQHKNAFTYSRTGAAIVLEENNLSPHVLLSEINRLMEHPTYLAEMKKAATAFAAPDAAKKVAKILLGIALEHEN